MAMPQPDLTMQTFGKWTALAKDPEKHSKWIVRCACGALSSVEGSYLRNGRSTQCKSCASRHPRTLKHDHSGQTFGKLIVLEHLGSGSWQCRCECGVEKAIGGAALRGGQVSCGCSNPTKNKGEGHPRFNGTQVRYAAAHQRVTAARGRARDHRCIVCDEQATSWAYRGGSPNELKEWREVSLVKSGWLRYSPDPADYDPMCWGCHARKDVLEARSRD